MCSSDLSGNPQGTYLNDMVVYECGDNKWVNYDTLGEKPSPRSDTQMIYDTERGTIVLFGGWANRWFDDVHVCKVSDVVGPPYSINGISPGIGPITGNTMMEIKGLGFNSAATKNATIRYACQKGYLEVSGTVIDDSTVVFDTPDFKKFGPVEVECRVSVANRPLTNASVNFSYFAVTDGDRTLAFGPGLCTGAYAQFPVSFVIEARDEHDQPRVCGMDEFSVRITPPSMAGELEGLGSLALPGDDDEADPMEMRVTVDVADKGDGTYIVTYTAPAPGDYSIAVDFFGTFDGNPGPVRGSPFKASFAESLEDDEKSKLNNSLDGPVMLDTVKNTVKDLKEFCNNKKRGMNKAPTDVGDSVAPLIEVKAHLRSITEETGSSFLTIAANRTALAYLKKKGASVDRLVDSVNQVEEMWTEVLDLGPKVAAAIVPQTKEWAQRTEDDVIAYTEGRRASYEAFKQQAFWNFETGVEKSLAELQATDRKSVV